MSTSLLKALKTVQIIEHGSEFTSFMDNIYFKEILDSEDKKLVKHLG